jgi:hypothetical protein
MATIMLQLIQMVDNVLDALTLDIPKKVKNARGTGKYWSCEGLINQMQG